MNLRGGDGRIRGRGNFSGDILYERRIRKKKRKKKTNTTENNYMFNKCPGNWPWTFLAPSTVSKQTVV